MESFESIENESNLIVALKEDEAMLQKICQAKDLYDDILEIKRLGIRFERLFYLITAFLMQIFAFCLLVSLPFIITGFLFLVMTVSILMSLMLYFVLKKELNNWLEVVSKQDIVTINKYLRKNQSDLKIISIDHRRVILKDS